MFCDSLTEQGKSLVEFFSGKKLNIYRNPKLQNLKIKLLSADTTIVKVILEFTS